MSREQLSLLNDEELVVLSNKESEAFGILMQRYESRLLAYIRRLSNIRLEDAEDILQESYLKAYLNINDFDPSLKFSSWLYRIVHNETVSDWRKRKVRPSVILENEDWEKIRSEDDLHHSLMTEDDRQHLVQVISELPDKYREVIILKFLEERSYEEIADILRKPVGTIGTLINRAKKKLQAKL
jgi:RNA polymerase sigma-70 factor, ECF subfamily